MLAAAGASAALTLGLVEIRALLPALGVVYALERLATEWWKAIARVDDQSAYMIPMRLGFRGRPVEAAWIRYLVGALVVVGLVGTGLLVDLAQHTTDSRFAQVAALAPVADVELPMRPGWPGTAPPESADASS